MGMTTGSMYYTDAPEAPKQPIVAVVTESQHIVNSAWVRDIAAMHAKFGVNPVVREFDKEKLKAFLQFRIDFLQEELNEMKDAKTADDVVDALIDLCVVAIGTLDAFDVKSDISWDRVHAANMTKSPGIKASRPNVLGLPDLIKPSDFVSPAHHDNVGLFAKIYG